MPLLDYSHEKSCPQLTSGPDLLSIKKKSQACVHKPSVELRRLLLPNGSKLVAFATVVL